MELQPFLMCYTLCVVYANGMAMKINRVHQDELVSKWEHNDTENSDYDHEAFLGQEEAETFKQLTPEESKERLGMMVDLIDEDTDGFVTPEELMKWIKHVQRRWIHNNIDGEWNKFDLNRDGVVSWEEYKNVTYGTAFDDPDSEDGLTYRQMMMRDERRFKVADLDGDQNANKTEYASFIYPEHFEHMEDIALRETMGDMDKNGDGVVDLGEYIGERYLQEDVRELESVRMDRRHFTKVLDKNTDGKLDKAEILDWILPAEHRHAEAEAKHLFLESDADKDGRLTKYEILDKYDLFVGSKATDFGKVLNRHDEF